jgi:tight adherence protein C
MLILAALVVFAAIVCLVLAVAWREDRGSTMATRLAGLRGERTVFEYGHEAQASLGARVLLPLAESLGDKLENVLPTRWVQSIERKLVQAGRPVSLTGYLIGASLAAGGTVVTAFTLVIAGHLGGKEALMLLAASTGLGLYLPLVWLSNRVRFRQKEILKSLPDAFDLITVCVEAGLGLEAALARVGEQARGPFGDELAVCLREIAMGKLRRDALKELAERTGVPDLTSFINAVVQAESMGTSIATVLRVQADQMRVRRRQRAEQAAHQAPVKMMFPLVLCIFPTLMIVILGPAAITVYHQLIAR